MTNNMQSLLDKLAIGLSGYQVFAPYIVLQPQYYLPCYLRYLHCH
ncbi:hypothetical protein [Shewanella sp. 10N.7]|nr:hypothetical protein [Shewanella sp. 10N.7]